MLKVPEFAAHLYDAVYLYARALDKTIEEKGNFRDGRRVFQNLVKLKSIPGTWSLLFFSRAEIHYC